MIPAPVRAAAGLGGWTPPTLVRLLAVSLYTQDPAQSVAMSADTDGLPPRLGIDRFHAPRQHTSITRQRYTDSPRRTTSFECCLCRYRDLRPVGPSQKGDAD